MTPADQRVVEDDGVVRPAADGERRAGRDLLREHDRVAVRQLTGRHHGLRLPGVHRRRARGQLRRRRLRHHSVSGGTAGWYGGGAGRAGWYAGGCGREAGWSGAATRLTTTASPAGPPRCRLSGFIDTANRAIRCPRT